MKQIATSKEYDLAYQRLDEISFGISLDSAIGPICPSDSRAELIAELENQILTYELKNNMKTECCNKPLLHAGCYRCSLDLESFQ